MSPLFSIVTPTYNCRAKIEDTIASVLSQNFKDFEYFLIDGSSTDGTKEYVSTIEDLRVLSASAPDLGIYDAMNKGIRLSKGRFIYFLGAGDKMRPNVLTEIATFIKQSPSRNPDFIYGNVNWVSQGNKQYDGAFSKSKLVGKNICHQAIFYDRRLFELFGLYESAYPVWADWAFNMYCYGSRKVNKRYVDITISDYEGRGFSDELSDTSFQKHFFRRAADRLGYWSVIEHWLRPRLVARCKWLLR